MGIKKAELRGEGVFMFHIGENNTGGKLPVLPQKPAYFM